MPETSDPNVLLEIRTNSDDPSVSFYLFFSSRANCNVQECFFNQFTDLNISEICFFLTKMIVFPPSLKCLKHLNSVTARFNHQLTSIDTLFELPEFIRNQLKRLLIVDSTNCKISNNFNLFDNLTQLTLENVNLTTIPETILQLSNLQTLMLKNNKISKISDNIKNLYKLTSLELGYNNLTSLNPQIATLKHLNYVGCNGNILKKVPIEILFLQKTTVINLERNQITSLIPTVYEVRKFKKYLFLSKNNKRYNRRAKRNLYKQRLFCIYKNLKPRWFVELDHLRCKLRYKFIFLSNITRININENKITKVPSAIRYLKNLRDLQVKHNLITSISPHLFNLPYFNAFFVDNNLLQFVPFFAKTYKTQNLMLSITNNHIGYDNVQEKGYGYDSLNKIQFKMLDISKPKVDIEMIIKLNNENIPHWNIESLNKCKIDLQINKAIKELKISDRTMLFIWNNVLKYFIFSDKSTNEIDEMDNIEQSDVDLDILNLIRKIHEGNVLCHFENIKKQENTSLYDIYNTRLAVAGFLESLSEDSHINMILKFYIKEMFIALLKQVNESKDDTRELESVYECITNLCRYCLIDCPIKQIDGIASLYSIYNLTNDFINNDELIEFFKTKIAVIKERMFSTINLINLEQQSNIYYYSRKYLRDLIGVSCEFKDLYDTDESTEYSDPIEIDIEAENGHALKLFLKMFTIPVVLHEILDDINSKNKLKELAINYLKHIKTTKNANIDSVRQTELLYSDLFTLLVNFEMIVDNKQ